MSAVNSLYWGTLAYFFISSPELLSASLLFDDSPWWLGLGVAVTAGLSYGAHRLSYSSISKICWKRDAQQLEFYSHSFFGTPNKRLEVVDLGSCVITKDDEEKNGGVFFKTSLSSYTRQLDLRAGNLLYPSSEILLGLLDESKRPDGLVKIVYQMETRRGGGAGGGAGGGGGTRQDGGG